MSWLETTFQKLRNHFIEVTVRPPADRRDRVALGSRFDSIPEDVEYYYAQCNGITVGLQDDAVGHLFPLDRSLARMPVAVDCEPERRFVPIRGDGCGDYDCVVLGDGPAEGAVVFWDHEVCEGPAYLLGGCFSSYLQMWADHLVNRYLPNGEEDRRYRPLSLAEYPWVGEPKLRHPWPFNEEWMASRDARAARILNEPAARSWLLRQDE